MGLFSLARKGINIARKYHSWQDIRAKKAVVPNTMDRLKPVIRIPDRSYQTDSEKQPQDRLDSS